jgi:hypothetical protein
VSGSAVLSPDGVYRYRLTRAWGRGRFATFVMLNPSTADATADDPTIRRCLSFARAWGCGGLVVVNVYALRSPSPAELWRHADPVGPENDSNLAWAASAAARAEAPLVAAWGVHAEPARVDAVRSLPGMSRLAALGVTKDGHPRHPLYLRGDSELRSWT